MTDTKASNATRSLIKSIQEANKAIADATVVTQKHNLAFAQSVLENSIKVLNSNTESARAVLQDLIEQTRKQQAGPESFQALVDSTVAAQERNIKLAQSVLENGVEVLKSQVNVTHSLMQELEQQFQQQQKAFQTLTQESVEAYRDIIFAPLTFWQKALSVAEDASKEGLKTLQKSATQGSEMLQASTRRVASMADQATQR
jgi:hypothetical protein